MLTMANDTNPLISISNDYIINKKLTELNYFSLNKDNMKPYLENSVVWIKRGNNDYKTTLLNLADYMIKRLRDNQIIAWL
jgi:hypothetical protein